MITYLVGDATDPVERPAIITHIVNNIGAWGSGFVLAVSKRWTAPKAAYHQWIRDSEELSLGSCQFVPVEDGLWVANMVGQDGIRRVNGVPPIRYGAVEDALEAVAVYAKEVGASVHMPRIGCGLAGGSWDQIEPLIKSALEEHDVYVYDFASSKPVCPDCLGRGVIEFSSNTVICPAC